MKIYVYTYTRDWSYKIDNGLSVIVTDILVSYGLCFIANETKCIYRYTYNTSVTSVSVLSLGLALRRCSSSTHMSCLDPLYKNLARECALSSDRNPQRPAEERSRSRSAERRDRGGLRARGRSGGLLTVKSQFKYLRYFIWCAWVVGRESSFLHFFFFFFLPLFFFTS